ncbi:MAG: hypothetical protein ACXWZY_09240 [Gaiellaceae bacterium]
MAGDQELRDAALEELFGNIWHQGTVYESTSHAVPYLVEVALHAGTDPETRNGVVALLAEIANGSSYLDVHKEYLKESANEADLEQELAWVRDAREAVRRHLPDLLASLQVDKDPSTHVVLADLMAQFPDDVKELRPHETQRSEAKTRRSRA